MRPGYFSRAGRVSLVLTVISGYFLAGCTGAATTVPEMGNPIAPLSVTQPAPSVIPEALATVQPTLTQVPPSTATLQPSATLALPTQTLTLPIPSATLTGSAPLPSIPKGYLRILTPGPLSKVISPINLEASVVPGPEGLVRIELIGEDGQVLSRQLLRFGTLAGQRISINPQIDFEITGVAETARVQISVDDPFGRTASLTSVELVLLSLGDAEIFANGNILEPVIIRQPTPNQIVTGGELEVQGMARPSGNQSLSLELITDQGTVVGTRQAALGVPGVDGYALYQTEIPYHLETPAWARLLVHEPSPRLPGDAAISSLKVYLRP